MPSKTELSQAGVPLCRLCTAILKADRPGGICDYCTDHYPRLCPDCRERYPVLCAHCEHLYPGLGRSRVAMEETIVPANGKVATCYRPECGRYVRVAKNGRQLKYCSTACKNLYHQTLRIARRREARQMVTA